MKPFCLLSWGYSCIRTWHPLEVFANPSNAVYESPSGHERRRVPPRNGSFSSWRSNNGPYDGSHTHTGKRSLSCDLAADPPGVGSRWPRGWWIWVVGETHSASLPVNLTHMCQIDSFLGATVQRTRFSNISKMVLSDDAAVATDSKETKVISGFNILTNNQVCVHSCAAYAFAVH